MEKETKNQKVIKTVLVSLVVILLALCIYFIFIKKDKNKGVVDNQPQSNINNTEGINIDVESLITKLESVNKNASTLMSKNISKDEFKKNAKNYFTDEMIEKLLNYYHDGIGVCINAAACSVDGGYLGGDANRGNVFFQISKITSDSIDAVGMYGEIYDVEDGLTLFAIENLQKQKINYKLEKGIWKINSFDIKDFR